MEKILNLNRDPEATAQEEEILNTTGRSNKPTLLFAAAEVSSKEVQFKDLKSKFSSVCSKSKAAEVQVSSSIGCRSDNTIQVLTADPKLQL